MVCSSGSLKSHSPARSVNQPLIPPSWSAGRLGHLLARLVGVLMSLSPNIRVSVIR